MGLKGLVSWALEDSTARIQNARSEQAVTVERINMFILVDAWKCSRYRQLLESRCRLITRFNYKLTRSMSADSGLPSWYALTLADAF